LWIDEVVNVVKLPTVIEHDNDPCRVGSIGHVPSPHLIWVTIRFHHDQPGIDVIKEIMNPECTRHRPSVSITILHDVSIVPMLAIGLPTVK